MKCRILSFFMMVMLYSAYGQSDCDVDTTYFKLPQNEFTSDRAWFTYTQGSGYVWTGNTNYYDMYDPCVAAASTVIISEVNTGAGDFGTYMEIANVGTEPVDLSAYRLVSQRNLSYPTVKVDRMGHAQLSGTLAPGETYILMGYSKYSNVEKGVMDRQDSILRHNPLLAEKGDLKYNISTSAVFPFIMGRPYDILGTNWPCNYSLVKVIGDTAEVIVDVFERSYVEGGVATIAGVPNAANEYTVVRKQFAGDRTYGNPNFIIGSGQESAEASEWILIPRFRNGTTHLPTTIGSFDKHSVFSVAAKEGVGATVNESNSTISLPWGTYSGDSVLSFLNVGADMAWAYKTNGVFEDDQSVLAHTGDTITFYHCGVDVTIKSYRIEVTEAADDMVYAYCKKRASDLARMYFESNGLAVDTIYGTRLYHEYPVDTLLNYIEIAKGAAADIIWVNNDEPRPTLKDGDKLRVTAKDGSTHDYYIALIPYDQNILSHDARMEVITWPDYPEEDIDPYIWTLGDTIPGFNKDGYSYIVELPAGTDMIPVLQAFTYNPRARITEIPAENLYGTVDQQTYKFVVTAEDDTTQATYSIRFVVETEDFTYEGTPFFSEVCNNYNTGNLIMEICNPGNVLLDLGDYAIAHGKADWKTVQSLLNWQDPVWSFTNVHIYRPGFVYDSLKMATHQQYWWDPNGDADVDSYVEAGGVFTVVATKGNGSTWGAVDAESGLWAVGAENGVVDGPNVVLHGNDDTRDWSWNKHAGNQSHLIGRTVWGGDGYGTSNTLFLLKIVNDSIKDGTKMGSDAADYELVDVIGKIEDGRSHGWLNPVTGVPFFPTETDFLMQRNSNIFKGNPESMGSFGYAGIESPVTYDAANPIIGDSAAFEWGISYSRPSHYDIGRHTLAPVTVYKSQISSSVYKVSPGLSADETVEAVALGTTVGDFITNIIKQDVGQSLVVTDATETSFLFDMNVITDGDKLVVTSADGANKTVYSIRLGELNSDVSLTSTTYTVNESSVTLNAMDVTINDLIAGLSVNEKSKLYIVNEGGALMSGKMLNMRDTTYVDALATNGLSVKVLAQNGTSKLYPIVVEATPTEAYITSNNYVIDQDEKVVYGVLNGTNVTALLAQLTPSTGATATVLNKWAQQKEFGILIWHDVVKVVSNDGSKVVYYGITLQSEEEPEVILDASAIENSSDLVFPNPTAGTVFLPEGMAKVTVFDLAGTVVKTVRLKTSKLSLSDLNSGVYMLLMEDLNGDSKTVKVIKE